MAHPKPGNDTPGTVTPGSRNSTTPRDLPTGTELPYGADAISESLHSCLADLLAIPTASAFAVGSGVAANALALATLVGHQGVVYCTPMAHLRVSEHGAPAFHSGADFVTVPDDGFGRMDPHALAELLDHRPAPQGSILSLTDLSEQGTVLGAARARQLQQIAQRHGLRTHLDGARLLDSAASVGGGEIAASIAALRAVATGFDAISLGITKNGGMTADVVVFADNTLNEQFVAVRDRGAHRPSKLRFLSAQVAGVLSSPAWVARATHAHTQATTLAKLLEQIPTVRIIRPVDANHLFVDLGVGGRQRLTDRGWRQYPWDSLGPDVVRVVTNWNTTCETIEAFADIARTVSEMTP